MYFPQYDTQAIHVTMQQVFEALRAQGLITEEMTLTDVVKHCYCEDDWGYCTCHPEELVFLEYKVKPNVCETCGAQGIEWCKSSGGKRRSRYHKKRKVVE